MAQEQAPQQQTNAQRSGSRWIYAPPEEEQVRDWFHSQPLHQGMEHGPYLGGIVIIPAKEKIQVTRRNNAGAMFVREEERSVYTPYVKVDTRIAYFWDLVRTMNALHEAGEGEIYVGVIEPVPQARITDIANPYFNGHLPEGFFVYAVKNADESTNRYLCCQWRVAIYERESYAQRVKGAKARPILQGIGTKQTPMSKRYADDNAIMKAETGAIGRALGVAGILVVGTGVATAEDMQEAQANETQPTAATAPTLPEVTAPSSGAPPSDVPSAETPGVAVPTETSDEQGDAALRERALALQGEMERDHPAAWAAYKEWWTGRNFGRLSELSGPALKGAVVKLERELDGAKQEGAADA